MNWKKALVITFNVIIGIYLVLAVTAFNKPVEKDIVCKDVNIVVEKGVIEGFLTPDGVRRMLLESGLNPVGKALADVNLRQMEEKLETQQLVEEAECYKTQDGKVCVRVKERVPVVRVMAQNGDDYYVDKDGKVLQNTGVACNLLVATGAIDRRFASRVLAPMGRLIVADEFWRSQIEQIKRWFPAWASISSISVGPWASPRSWSACASSTGTASVRLAGTNTRASALSSTIKLCARRNSEELKQQYNGGRTERFHCGN